jgi:hypothetical protein
MLINRCDAESVPGLAVVGLQLPPAPRYTIGLHNYTEDTNTQLWNRLARLLGDEMPEAEFVVLPRRYLDQRDVEKCAKLVLVDAPVRAAEAGEALSCWTPRHAARVILTKVLHRNETAPPAFEKFKESWIGDRPTFGLVHMDSEVNTLNRHNSETIKELVQLLRASLKTYRR